IGSPYFPNSSKFNNTWGRIIDYNNCGNYEFVQVENIPNATTIIFDCALQNDYTVSGRVLIVRVPRYSSLTINSGGTINTTQWNGTSGGVIAIEVEGTTTINNGGSIDASALGFRGGNAAAPQSSVTGGTRFADSNPLEGGEKGEGIGGDQSFYSTMNDGGSLYCMGAPANGGGGGNAHNAGGGGGSNAGNINNWNNGVGIPDPTYNASWIRETPSIVGINASGGGKGGYSFFDSNSDPTATSPGDPAWGGDFRRNVGGSGGRPLDYSSGRIFIGGGGGAGDGNDGEAGDGGNGGGIIYLSTYGDITGAGQIISNGGDGGDVIGTSVFNSLRGKDAGGGGGGGGSVILKTTGTISLSGSVSANGGIGGDQVLVAGAFYGSIDEGEGPGGGGGGGYIAISAGTPTRNTTGGISGVTNCPYVANFPPNGATGGGTGINNAIVNAFDIVANGTTICSNTTATLTASLTGTPPGGTVFEWYDNQFNGSLLFTGASFTTPTLTTTTSYWVRVCPAPYLVEVIVTVNSCSSVTTSFSSSDSTLCSSDCINFTDLSTGSPTGWTWYFPGSSTPTSSAQNPTNICYPSPGNYDVSLVATDGITPDSLYMSNFISVINCSVPSAIYNVNDSTICVGDSVVFTDASTGSITGWDWNFDLTTIGGSVPNSANTQGSHTVFYNIPGTYTVELIVTDGILFDTTTSTIIVSDCSPTANFSANGSTTICEGDSLSFNNLSTGLPTNWEWTFTGGTPSTFSGASPGFITYPSAGTYSVKLKVSNAYGADSLTLNNLITVNVCSPPIAKIATDDVDREICINNCIDFSYNGTGGTPLVVGWIFEGGTPDSSSTLNPGLVCWNDTSDIFKVYVIANNLNGSSIDSVSIIVHEKPILSAGLDTTIINGNDAYLNSTVTDTAGNPIIGGVFSWTPITDLSCVNCQNTTAERLLNTVTYTVTYTDQYGCVVTDEVVINVDVNLNIGIPSAFSPNGDGSNDFLFVRGKAAIKTLQLNIYNRYGQKVFSTNNVDQGWDGTHNGVPLNPGVFAYYANITLIDGSTQQLKGNITLVR
ncbi:MAG: gliding motility-associated C-terminal domain-containing protein, partial [Vicingus serpentipes]|nr:gliding motility-associated C-terminal domain-containing protein [Vicingus serpentipes]